jgi:hypothetical protein
VYQFILEALKDEFPGVCFNVSEDGMALTCWLQGFGSVLWYSGHSGYLNVAPSRSIPLDKIDDTLECIRTLREVAFAIPDLLEQEWRNA